MRHPETTPEELEVLAGIDVDEYFVESIIDHEESWLNWNDQIIVIIINRHRVYISTSCLFY